MIKQPLILSLLLVVGSVGWGCTPAPNELPRIVIYTPMGEIEAELDTLAAPLTALHFLQLVEDARLDGGSFYRVVRLDNQPQSPVKIEVIQGGLRGGAAKIPSIAHETTAQSGLTHLRGTLSMARAEVGSASSEFFICVEDTPSLDFGGARNPDGQGFAAFGSVVKGMELVEQIQALPDSEQYLTKPLAIDSVRVQR